MATANSKRVVSLPFAVAYGPLNDVQTSYGSMTARVGLFEALFKEGADMVAGCNKTDRRVTVSRHDRQRKVGGPVASIEGHTYDVEIFPKKNISFGKGGEEYRVLVDGSWWGFRLSGKQSTFHSFLCANRSKLKENMHYKSQRGASYFVNKQEEG